MYGACLLFPVVACYLFPTKNGWNIPNTINNCEQRLSAFIPHFSLYLTINYSSVDQVYQKHWQRCAILKIDQGSAWSLVARLLSQLLAIIKHKWSNNNYIYQLFWYRHQDNKHPWLKSRYHHLATIVHTWDWSEAPVSLQIPVVYRQWVLQPMVTTRYHNPWIQAPDGPLNPLEMQADPWTPWRSDGTWWLHSWP